MSIQQGRLLGAGLSILSRRLIASSYPRENLFRAPVELVSVTAGLAGITILWALPATFSVSAPMQVATTVILSIISLRRALTAAHLLKFQRNLRRLPAYSIAAADIPFDDKALWIGAGFRWTQKHTQRLFDARLPQNEHLRARNALYDWARDYERRFPLSWLSGITAKNHWANPVSPLPPVGGDPAIHGVELDERPMWMDLAERVGHTIVLGTTRVGKTRLCELLVTQDIARGDVVIVFDPKGDVALLMRMYAETVRAGREKDFWFFHLGYPEVSARYSPVGTIGRITEVATRIAGQLPGEGQSAAFREFVWRFINVMAKAMSALGQQITYENVYETAVNIDGLCIQYFNHWLNNEHDGWQEQIRADDKAVNTQAQKTGRSKEALEILALMREKGWSDSIADGLASVLSNDRSYFEKLVSSLYPLLEKLTTGKVSELLSPNYTDINDPRPIFDWEKIINTGGIVYVGLDALSDTEVAGAVGNSMFADLTSTAGRIYKHGNAYGQSTNGVVRALRIHADEFNELIGDEFVPMINKAGGAGYSVTAYTQTWSDVEARIGNAAKAAQIAGNFNTTIMLRVKNTETAELLTEQLPEVEIITSTMVSGANDAVNPHDSADFSAGAQDRSATRPVPMLQPTDLVQLPKGQAFALIEGGQLVKLRFPLPEAGNDPLMPPNLLAIAAKMRTRTERLNTLIDTAGLSQDGLSLDQLANLMRGETDQAGVSDLNLDLAKPGLVIQGARYG